METICIIFRKSDPSFHSIERIFTLLSKEFRKKFEIQTAQLPANILKPLNLIKNFLYTRKLNASVYHITGAVHYAVLWLPGKRTILTIHDCGFIHNSRGLKRWILHKFWLSLPVKHCAAITTISEFSKKDIIELTGCSPEKITVIPNPVDSKIYYKHKVFSHEKPIVLFIGSTPNKNLERVIEAVEGVNCHLEIVGHIPENLRSRLRELKIDHNISFDLSDEELAEKYVEADVMLFPSTFEGFGLPIIEANKAGRPIITSNLSPMKEVADGAAYLVDPLSVSSIKEGLVRVLTNATLRDDLVEKGLQNVKKYEHFSISVEYVTLYSRLIGIKTAETKMAESLI